MDDPVLREKPRERHKAIAIPMSTVNDQRYFLIVHDRRYREWTFVTGGCRRREVYNPLRCAVRELEEETRGTINLKRGSYAYFKFSTDTPEPKDIEDGVSVINHYHVYVFDLPMTPIEHKHIVQRFKEEKEKRKELCDKFTNLFKKDNSRFDDARFAEACNVK